MVKIKTREVGDVIILDCVGNIGLASGASTFCDTMFDLAEGSKKKAVLNLAEVGYIDSTGIGHLVNGSTNLGKKGIKLKLLNPTKRVKDLFMLTKLYTVFEIYEDEAAAVRSFA